jgi:hypothetical protein
MKTTKTCRSRERDEPYRLKKRTQNICRRFVHGAILVILQIFNDRHKISCETAEMNFASACLKSCKETDLLPIPVARDCV